MYNQASTSTLVWSTSLSYSNVAGTIVPVGSSFSTNSNNSLEVTGDANFKGDIKWKGRSLSEFLRSIEDRLAILVPDPDKLERFEALKKSYHHYKTLEALCVLPDKEEK